MTSLTSENARLDAALESPALAPFAMWELDLAAAVHPDGTPLCPSLKGRHTPLWYIHSNRETEAAHESDELARAHKQRVELMALRVANQRDPFEGYPVPPLDKDGYDLTDMTWPYMRGVADHH